MFRPRERRRIGNATVDRGFDSESNHEFAHRQVGANSVIPLRWDLPLSKTKGYYRRRLRRHFPKKEYDRRPIVETINSVEKRKFGDELRSKLLKTQRREMKVIDIVYNIHRYINYVVSAFEDFYRAEMD